MNMGGYGNMMNPGGAPPPGYQGQGNPNMMGQNQMMMNPQQMNMNYQNYGQGSNFR